MDAWNPNVGIKKFDGCFYFCHCYSSFLTSLPKKMALSTARTKRFQCHFNTTSHCPTASVFGFVQLLYLYQLYYKGFRETVNAVIPRFKYPQYIISEGKRTTIPYHTEKILHPKILSSILKDSGLATERFHEP